MLFIAYVLLYSIVIIAFFAIGLLVLIRQKTLVYRNFAFFSFFTGIWQLLELTAQLLSAHHVFAVTLFQLSIIAATLTTAFLLLFAASYTKRNIPFLPFITGTTLIGALAFFSK